LQDQIPQIGQQRGRRRCIADALQAVRDGRLDATVFQDATGQAAAAVDTAAKMIRGQPYEKQVLIPFLIPSNPELLR